MDEKFSVSLELALNKWKSQIATAKKSMQSLGQTAKSRIAIDNSPLKQMTAQQELLKKQVMDLQQTLVMAQQDTKLFSPSEVLEMRVELEKLESQLNDTTKSSTAFKKVGDNISGTMKKGMQSAKRFTLSLFGIHSIYRMLSRASSAYLAQDTETTNKIQAAWIGLGSVFAPLLQMVAEFAIKAVSYLNIFIKALTGLDFLGNAMAKSMGKANKSAKTLSKTLAGIDEITNLDNNADGMGESATDWISAFKNVQLDDNLVKFFKDLGEKLKPKNVENFWKDIHKFWEKDWKNYFQNVEGNWSLFIEGIGLTIKGFYDIFKGIFDTIVGIVKSFVGIFTGDMTVLRDGWKQLCDGLWGMLKGAFEIIGGIIGMALGIIKGIFLDIVDWIYATIIKPIGNFFVGLWNGIKNVFSNVGDFFKSVFKGASNIIEGAFSGIGGFFSNLWYGIKYGVISMANFIISAINGMVKGVLAPLNVIIKGINSLTGGKIKTLSFSISKIDLPRLDTGTSYVPNNQLAMIHQGEAVIPKKFNSREYFGMGNDDTNKLLEELIDKVENIEINPYTTIKDVGTASVGYINTQNRIMGRGVI